jgi:acylphosphatase
LLLTVHNKNDLKGFVRNIPGGSARVIAEGPDDLLLEFIRYLHSEGDPVILVSHPDVKTGYSDRRIFRIWYPAVSIDGLPGRKEL